MDILPGRNERIHFVGVGGAGNSALARVLRQWGYVVSGSDAERSDLTDALAAEGIAVVIGHAAANVDGAALVVRSAAVPCANPELRAARRAGVPVVKRAALLGLIAAGRVSIAVAGTHGKSTTSAMIAKVCRDAGNDPSFVIGAIARDFGTNAHAGSGELIVLEADEYDRSFLHLRPRVAVITNIEADHPDIYPTLDDIDEAFGQFARSIETGGRLVVSADDPGCARLRERYLSDRDGQVVTYGSGASADWRLGADGTIHGPAGPVATPLELGVPGLHNRLNALGAVAASAAVGIAPDVAIRSLHDFSGTERRFQVRPTLRGITMVDDYAHHPTEIIATIQAARERFPQRTIWAVFQPHTFSRTRLLGREFAAALAHADHVVLLDVYAARERDPGGVTSDDIARHLDTPPMRAEHPGRAAELLVGLATAGGLGTRPILLLLGAGDVWRVGERLARDLGD